MSSASGPPYPPGPYPSGRQAPPAALPGRPARALPAGSSPAEMEGDAAGDTTAAGGTQDAGGWFNRTGSDTGAPSGYPGSVGQQPGGYTGQQVPAWYPGPPSAGFAGQPLPGPQGPVSASGYPAGPGYGGPGGHSAAQHGYGPQAG